MRIGEYGEQKNEYQSKKTAKNDFSIKKIRQRNKRMFKSRQSTATKKEIFFRFFVFFTWCPKQTCNYVRIGVRSMKQWK